MNRLKLLIFALPLALWMASFALSSELPLGAVQEQGSRLAARTADAVTVRVDGRREELQQLALKLATSPALASAAQAAKLFRPDPVTPEKFAALRTAAFALIPEALQSRTILGVSAAAGPALFARGTADASEALPGFEPAALLQAGTDGTVRAGLKEPYLFFSLPLASSADGKPTALLVLGAPLVPKSLTEEVAQELSLEAVGLFNGDSSLQTSGPEAGLLNEARKVALPGKDGLLRGGSIGTLGPLELPFTRGRSVAQRVVARRALTSAPLEVVSVVSVRPLLEKIAEGQRSSLICLLGALGIFVFGWVVMGGGKPAAEGLEDEEEPEAAPEPARAFAPDSTLPGNAEMPGDLPPQESVAAEDPFASFGTPSPAAPPGAAPGLNFGDYFSAPPPVPDESGSDAEAGSPFRDSPEQDHQPTMAYQISPPPEAYAPSSGEVPYNPDATRVAAIPSELLRASARTVSSDDVTTIAVPSRATSTGASAEDLHFQEVFREFVSTRERCGEPADGLTLDKFSAKLRKNRDQLIQKYNCRSVKFQVYVKEGKAALKATPVKS